MQGREGPEAVEADVWEEAAWGDEGEAEGGGEDEDEDARDDGGSDEPCLGGLGMMRVWGGGGARRRVKNLQGARVIGGSM